MGGAAGAARGGGGEGAGAEGRLCPGLTDRLSRPRSDCRITSLPRDGALITGAGAARGVDGLTISLPRSIVRGVTVGAAGATGAAAPFFGPSGRIAGGAAFGCSGFGCCGCCGAGVGLV